ncbi:glycine zipper 2TM domain-containing protein [uncultured Sphingomonas sp.]|uniref:glycine zipper 2TM domain-containing protein n=1 Tax=uncultured Sphingomonas sp. TaxID=158754 RepID=UPI0035C982E1
MLKHGSMLKHCLSGAALLAAAAMLAPTAATAQLHGYTSGGHAPRGYDRGGYPDRSGYNRPGYRPARCDNGTGGTIIGAIAGGLLGRSIDTRGDRALGTVPGAGAGALAGNAIGRSGNPGYCRR